MLCGSPTSMSRALLISVLASSIGPFMTGFHLGVLNPMLPALTEDFSLTGRGQNLVFSVLIGAAAVGAVFAGKVADWFGLKKAQETLAILFTAGALVSTVSHAPVPLFIMLIGRLLVGLACGACTVLQPRYVKEISPRKLSGFLSSSMQLALVVGLVVAFLFGIPYEHDMTTISFKGWEVAWWRVVLLIGTMTSFTQIIALAYSEESPEWLSAQGKVDEAAQTYARVGIVRSDAAQEPLLPQAEVETWQQWREQMQEWFSRRDYRRSSLLAVAVAVFQQLGGINTVIFYSTGILKNCGVSSPIYATVLVGIVNVLFTAVAAYLVDHAGRKTLLIVSHGGCFASLSILTLAIYIQGLEDAAGVSLCALMAFVAFFALGSGPVPFMYVPEILPDEISSTVQSFAFGANWVANFIVTASFPISVDHIGLWPTYAGYSLLNLLAVALFIPFMVETGHQPHDTEAYPLVV